MRFSRLLIPLVFVFLLVPITHSLSAQSRSPSVGVLVIAHGATGGWNAPVVAAVESVRSRMPAAVGFLMGEGPRPQEAYDSLVKQGASRLVVVPLLISSHSAHAEQIRFLAGARPDYPHAEHMSLVQLKGPIPIATVTTAMDDDPIVGAILADRARALSRDPKAESLVIVAHGPNDDDEAAIWISVMERLATHVRGVLPFRDIDLRLLRDDAPKPVKDRALAELRATVSTRATSGRVAVIPLLLSPGKVADQIPPTLAGLEFGWDGRTLLPDDRIADWIVARATGVSNVAQTGTGDAKQAHEVAGQVLDPDGLPIPGAVVVMRNTVTGLERVTASAANGAFAFQEISSGDFEVIATLSGFAAAREHIRAPIGGSVALVLRPSAYEEAVTVVSDARRVQLREATALPVTVLGGEAMRDAAYGSVGEALREVAGVVPRRGSEAAGIAGEQIQGIDSRQVLVLVDGQPIVGARGIKSGAIDLDRESVVGLDRVEIIKGASSALYGSDAIGGVINLIPRDPRRPLEIGGRMFGGTHGSIEAAGSVGAMTRWGTLFMSGGRRQRETFDLTPSTVDTTGAAFQRNDVTGRVSMAPSPSWLLTGTMTSYWNVQRGRSVGELGPQEDRIPASAQTYGARASWRIDPRTTAEFRAYRARYAETSAANRLDGTPLPPGDLFEGLSKADASVARSIGEHQQLQGGVEWLRDAYRGRNRIRDASGNSATTGVAWGQHEISPFRVLTVTTGVRVDEHSVFGTAVSPKLAAVGRLTGALTARVSFGRGFRAPDLGQLYYRFLNPTSIYQVIGNPHLQPERSSSWQTGLEARIGARGHVGVNLFHNGINNLIQAVNLGFITTPGQLAGIAAAEQITPDFDVQLNRSLFLYKNVARVRTRGADLTGTFRVAPALRVAGTYAYLEAIDANTGAALQNRNRHQGAVRVDWTPRFGVRANLRGAFYSSWIAGTSRTTASSSNIVAPRFALWNLTVSKTVRTGLDAVVAIDNLTNSQDPNTGLLSSTGAALPIYRPDIGRTARIGVVWSWSGR